MKILLVATEDALVVIRGRDDPEVYVALSGARVRCAAVDARRPGRANLGTAEAGLLRSVDGG